MKEESCHAALGLTSIVSGYKYLYFTEMLDMCHAKLYYYGKYAKVDSQYNNSKNKTINILNHHRRGEGVEGSKE